MPSVTLERRPSGLPIASDEVADLGSAPVPNVAGAGRAPCDRTTAMSWLMSAPDERRGDARAGGQRDGEGVARRDDVRVGDDVALAIEDDARAEADAGLDLHHLRRHGADDAHVAALQGRRLRAERGQRRRRGDARDVVPEADGHGDGRDGQGRPPRAPSRWGAARRSRSGAGSWPLHRTRGQRHGEQEHRGHLGGHGDGGRRSPARLLPAEQTGPVADHEAPEARPRRSRRRRARRAPACVRRPARRARPRSRPRWR